MALIFVCKTQKANSIKYVAMFVRRYERIHENNVHIKLINFPELYKMEFGVGMVPIGK